MLLSQCRNALVRLIGAKDRPYSQVKVATLA